MERNRQIVICVQFGVFFGDITQNSCVFPITGCIVISFAVTAARACFQKEGVVSFHAYQVATVDYKYLAEATLALHVAHHKLPIGRYDVSDKGDVAQGQNSLTHSRSGVNCICTFCFIFHPFSIRVFFAFFLTLFLQKQE